MGYRVAVAGASGYAGGELLRLLSAPSRPRGRRGHRPRERRPAGRCRCTRSCARWPNCAFARHHRGGSGRRRRGVPGPAARRVRVAGRPLADVSGSSTSARTTGWSTPPTYERYYGGAQPRRLDLRAARTARPAGAHRCQPRGWPTPAATRSPPSWRSRRSSPPAWLTRQDIVVTSASGTSGAGRAPAGAPARQRGRWATSRPTRSARTDTCPRSSRPAGHAPVPSSPVLAPDAARHPRHRRPAGRGDGGSVDEASVRAVLAAAYADEPFVHLLRARAAAAHGSHRSARTPPTCRPLRRQDSGRSSWSPVPSTTWARARRARPSRTPT